ncbi:cytosine permease [Actinomyces sp. B33]|uniref:purine-cytosine permease family protein n=1 Tax=Actinomyces sp. B33 TaxID=2942131 RepID=UPI002341F1D1|nr:cytosine permease [Actinomyces sp. B33]MDC4232766.1 cytosine permease [Actinomyces sp. B33]
MSTASVPDAPQQGALAVEMAGLDVIPESDRKGRPADLFMPWFAANISVLGISWGSWVLGFGISFVQAVVVSVIGVALSFLVCGLIAIAGKRGSAPTLVLSRAAFGYNGNRISAVISWILTVGWETFLCVMAVQASATVMGALGFSNHLAAQVISLVLVVALAAGSGILGFDMIMRVQTWITWATAVLTVIYLVLAFPTIDMGAVMALPAGSTAAVVGAGCMLLVGFGFGWINAAADYSRYLPRRASTAGVVGWTTFGAALPTVVLVFFGLLLAGSNAELNEAVSADPIGALTTILPTWFLIPFALVAILGLVGGIIMDIYSSGLSLLATGAPVSRPVATAIDGTIMTLGTIVVVFFSDSFFGPFQGFLTTLGVVIAGWGGVMLADIALRRKDYDEPSLFTPSGRYGSVNWGAIVSLALASLIGWGLVVNTSASWLSWQGYLLGVIGGKEGAWAFSNIGILLALVIGFVGYLATSSGRVRAQEREESRVFGEQ